MKIIDDFLREDMLIVRPSVFVYVPREQASDVINNGISLDKDYISCYLKRLPEDSDQYKDFLQHHVPIRITISKLSKIKDQKIRVVLVNMSENFTEVDLKNDDIINSLQKKYSSYLDVCYKDRLPLKNIPRIDIYLSKRFLPGIVCKVVKI